jgi:hypothetical protein
MYSNYPGAIGVGVIFVSVTCVCWCGVYWCVCCWCKFCWSAFSLRELCVTGVSAICVGVSFVGAIPWSYYFVFVLM